mmetsp:Transcript_75383/g.201443  ORF Transcript_75383/g.201443 Transcript_75383/m.201443 type:complete len:240 (+) Transcript_75383:513-1232(+)
MLICGGAVAVGGGPLPAGSSSCGATGVGGAPLLLVAGAPSPFCSSWWGCVRLLAWFVCWSQLWGVGRIGSSSAGCCLASVGPGGGGSSAAQAGCVPLWSRLSARSCVVAPRAAPAPSRSASPTTPSSSRLSPPPPRPAPSPASAKISVSCSFWSCHDTHRGRSPRGWPSDQLRCRPPGRARMTARRSGRVSLSGASGPPAATSSPPGPAAPGTGALLDPRRATSPSSVFCSTTGGRGGT